MTDAIITFPKDFLWGASTASYQIEGGNRLSALADWERRKGWEVCGDAAGSWERFGEDLACLKELKAGAYRFSVEWSRLQPEPDRFDEDALRTYAGWARRLRESGIRPFVTLHHFSEPAWLLKAHPRGWLDAAVGPRFLRFVERVASALREDVMDWVVLNEPMVFLVGAYGMRYFPPGKFMLTNVRGDFLKRLVPNFARAHNEAYKLLKRGQPAAQVGYAHHVTALEQASVGDDGAVADWDWFMHRHWLELTAGYFDFMGLNYYTRIFVHRSKLPFMPMGVVPGYAEFEHGVTPWVFRLLGGRRGARPRSGMGWEVVPEGLGRVVADMYRASGKPVYILENGIDDRDGTARDSFIRSHLTALAGAMREGADVRGYFHWSLLDNYEWGSYKPRFGLYDRQRRPAAGAELYREIAATGRLAAEEPALLG